MNNVLFFCFFVFFLFCIDDLYQYKIIRNESIYILRLLKCIICFWKYASWYLFVAILNDYCVEISKQTGVFLQKLFSKHLIKDVCALDSICNLHNWRGDCVVYPPRYYVPCRRRRMERVWTIKQGDPYGVSLLVIRSIMGVYIIHCRYYLRCFTLINRITLCPFFGFQRWKSVA